jgi:hypothetical protein
MTKFYEWVGKNKGNLALAAIIVVPSLALLSTVIRHEQNVSLVTRQNSGCIYLESSRLGVDQHYMFCDGRINLVHLAAEGEQPVSEPIDMIQNATAPAAPVAPVTDSK